MNSFYIYGLQRSGTNYLEQLLRQNFDVGKKNANQRNTPMWKHNTIVDNNVIKSKDKVFVIHKNPYMWIESICFRSAVDWTLTQLEFPATDKNSDDDYNIGKKGFNIVNLAKTYQTFYQNWVTATHPKIKEKSCVIKYEDLIVTQSREDILCHIADHFKYTRKTTTWRNPTSVGMSPSWKHTDADMYISQQPQYLTPKQIKIITLTLTPTLISNLGYAIL